MRKGYLTNLFYQLLNGNVDAKQTVALLFVWGVQIIMIVYCIYCEQKPGRLQRAKRRESMSKEQEHDARQAAYRYAHSFLVTGALFALVVWAMVDKRVATGDFLWRYVLAVLIGLLIQHCALWVGFRTWLR